MAPLQDGEQRLFKAESGSEFQLLRQMKMSFRTNMLLKIE